MVLMVIVILILVAILLIIKAAITPKGKVKIDINDGKKVLDIQGSFETRVVPGLFRAHL